MRIEAYLGIVSDEQTIRAIERETNLSSATVQPLKARRVPGGEEVWWIWRTPRTPIGIENPDDELRALLEAHKSIFPTIKKYIGTETEICLQMVTEYQEGEEPEGLSLSAETVHLLSEIGGALDNDVVIRGSVAKAGGS